jgi:hypothetical protein
MTVNLATSGRPKRVFGVDADYFRVEPAGREPPRPSSMPIDVEGGLIS